MNGARSAVDIAKGMKRLKQGIGLMWDSSPGLCSATLGLMFFQGILPLVPLYIIKVIIDAASAGARIENLLGTIAIMALSMIANSLLQSGGAFLRQLLAQRLSDGLQANIQETSCKLDMAYYEMPEFQDMLHRTQREAPYRPVEIVDITTNLFRSAVAGLSVSAVLLVVLPWYGLVLLAVSAVPGALVMFRSSRRLFTWRMGRTSAERQVFYLNWLLTAKSNVMENRIMGLSDFFLKKARTWRATLRTELMSLSARRSAGEFFASTFQIAVTMGLLIYLLQRSLAGSFGLGDLVLFFQALQRGQQSVGEMLRSAVRLFDTGQYLDDVFRFLNLPHRYSWSEDDSEGSPYGATTTGPARSRPETKQPDHVVVHPITGPGFHLQSVSFSYPSSNMRVLQDVSISVAPGEFVALVGDNGAGKSTVIKLLCGFYQPMCGALSHVSSGMEHPLADLSVLFQDFTQYYCSARENIWYGDIESKMHAPEIQWAAQVSGADEFIETLPLGYETPLGRWLEAGSELSGGQWKKLALARVLYRRAALTILDEPGASLDPESESRLIDSLPDIARQGSLLLVSHNISAARKADRIYVLREGRIIESGNHDQLVKNGGYYAGLFLTQARRYGEMG